MQESIIELNEAGIMAAGVILSKAKRSGNFDAFDVAREVVQAYLKKLVGTNYNQLKS